MRKPMLQAIVMGGVAVAGMLVAQHGLDMPYAPGLPASRQHGQAWVIAGLVTIVVAGWWSFRAGVIAWMRKRLIDCEDALAKWTVSPADWATLTGKRPPRGDTIVIIDTEAVVVGDSCTPIPASFNLLTYTQLSSLDWVETGSGVGGVLVFARMFRTYNQSYINFIWVPVPEAARGEAQAAIDAIDPLISDWNRENVESRFASELSAARSGDPSAATELMGRRVVGWGVMTALFGGAALWVSTTIRIAPGEIDSTWFWHPFGIIAVCVGVALTLIGLVMTFASFVLDR